MCCGGVLCIVRLHIASRPAYMSFLASPVFCWSGAKQDICHTTPARLASHRVRAMRTIAGSTVLTCQENCDPSCMMRRQRGVGRTCAIPPTNYGQDGRDSGDREQELTSVAPRVHIEMFLFGLHAPPPERFVERGNSSDGRSPISSLSHVQNNAYPRARPARLQAVGGCLGSDFCSDTSALRFQTPLVRQKNLRDTSRSRNVFSFFLFICFCLCRRCRDACHYPRQKKV